MQKEKFDEEIANIRSSLNASREKIGATEDVKIDWSGGMSLSEQFRSGVPLAGSVLVGVLKGGWQSLEPLIDEKGDAFVLYIHDFRNFYDGSKPTRVFHVSWCHTLKRMEEGGRQERYVRKSDLGNNDFNVDYGSDITGTEQLPACSNCRDKMKAKIAPDELYYSRDNLDIAKFFKMYGRQNLKNLNNAILPVGLPENWKQISWGMRERADWKCSQCHGDFSRDKGNLDVHHKNGVLRDVRTINLVVLCKECHSKQFAHGHYKHVANTSARSQCVKQKIDKHTTVMQLGSQMNKLENFIQQPERYATGTEKSSQKVKEARDYFESVKHQLTPEKQKEFRHAVWLYEKKLQGGS
jgi:hypothetical protein